MDQAELEQLLRYRQQELLNRLKEIGHDFEQAEIVDDILFSIAQTTKCELRNVKMTLELLERNEINRCCDCYSKIIDDLKNENPFQTPCKSCDNKRNTKK